MLIYSPKNSLNLRFLAGCAEASRTKAGCKATSAPPEPYVLRATFGHLSIEGRPTNGFPLAYRDSGWNPLVLSLHITSASVNYVPAHS